jgi:uncharacterized membrane protein
MTGTSWVLAAAIAFVGTHFLLSHPLRQAIVTAAGEKVFSGIYSLIALATFAWMFVAYRAAPLTAFLWPTGEALWGIATLVMLFASVLLMGSFVRNPALPNGGSSAVLPDEARGVFAITRHPMMWAFALWGCCHIAIFPVAKNLIVASAIVILSLLGATLQDRKKEVLQPDFWRAWEAKTSYWPFAAIVTGRARLGGFGWLALAGGLALWLVTTWAHKPLSGWAAGIWRMY